MQDYQGDHLVAWQTNLIQCRWRDGWIIPSSVMIHHHSQSPTNIVKIHMTTPQHLAVSFTLCIFHFFDTSQLLNLGGYGRWALKMPAQWLSWISLMRHERKRINCSTSFNSTSPSMFLNKTKDQLLIKPNLSKAGNKANRCLGALRTILATLENCLKSNDVLFAP